MWPINKQNPLRSPLLLENQIKKSNWIPTNKARVILAKPTPRRLRRVVDKQVVFQNPYHAKDLTEQFAKMNIANKGSRTQRVLFRKLEKAFDKKTLKL